MGQDDSGVLDDELLATLPLIGEGLRSAVYVLNDSTALKVYNEGVPESWAEYEARLTNVAFECGAPAPRNARPVSVGGRPGLAMELIDGPSLWTRIESATATELAEFGQMVASAQLGLAEIAASVALPHQWDRLSGKLSRAVASAPELAPALKLLGERDGRRSDLVCHGDLHLRNVLVTPTRTVLVDWFDASRGELAVEVARALVMFDVETVHVARVREVRAAYLERILAVTSIPLAEIERWMAVQWTARIGEGLDHHRVADVASMIDDARRGA